MGIRVLVWSRGGRVEEHVFDKSTVVVGRTEGADVVIPLGNVSKRHFEVSEVQGQLLIRDLLSCGGTYVDGMRLSHPEAIQDDERVLVGNHALAFSRTAPRPWDYPTGLQTRARLDDLLVLAVRDRRHEEMLVASERRIGEGMLRLRRFLEPRQPERLERRIIAHREHGHPRILPLAREWTADDGRYVLTRERVGVSLQLLLERAEQQGGPLPFEVSMNLFHELVHLTIAAEALAQRFPDFELRLRELFLGDDGYLRVAPDYTERLWDRGLSLVQQLGRVGYSVSTGDWLVPRDAQGKMRGEVGEQIEACLAQQTNLENLIAANPPGNNGLLAEFVVGVAGDVLEQQRALVDELDAR